MNTDAPPSGPILEVENLKTHFHTYAGVAKAVDGVSFYLNQEETLGIVGESGCGKSVTANSIMRLIPEPPGRVSADRLTFKGAPILDLDMGQMRKIRGKRISMIFQEPMTSLNPVFTIGDQIGEVFRLHKGLNRKQALDQAVEMLARVQIPSPGKRVHEYPHQLSGGMRQRAMIAMAMACNPEILIADEPTTALDVTIQAQIMDLMQALKAEFRSAILMITHDLGVIAEITQRVLVMYAGKVVEAADTETLFQSPAHPYTLGLLDSLPKLSQRAGAGRERLRDIKGMVPSLLHLPQGCGFAPRCTRTTPVCFKEQPPLVDLGNGHMVRCFLHTNMKDAQ